MSRFALAIGLGSFLSFVVQPLVARQLLPWFGGAPAVWTTCLVFFQCALVAGYGYAHVVAGLAPRRQAVHAIVAAAATLFLPVIVGSGAMPGDTARPTLDVLALLLRAVGGPYVVLAAGTPLLQEWARQRSGREPIRLYAISNAASLAALLSYPILIEPLVSIRHQGWLWSALFLCYVGAVALCAQTLWHTPAAQPRDDAEKTSAAPAIDQAIWLIAAATGSALLMATTNQLCQDIAAVPFLWVVPLAVYLASFIISFAGWYRRGWWASVFLAALVGAGYVLAHATTVPAIVQGALVLVLLAAGCMVCHGEIVHLRPAGARLSGFYLTIAVGGAIGGLAVAVVAPRVFSSYIEFPLLALAVTAVLGAAAGRDLERRPRAPMPRWLWLAPALLVVTIGSATVIRATAPAPGVLARRNFFGVLRVSEDAAHTVRTLYHGRVVHGEQFLDEGRRRVPTTYYGKGSGIALAIAAHSARAAGQPLRVGAVGLGVGTIAAWARAGDAFRFFEINPDVVTIARTSFTFLADSAARIDVVTGDGRLSLEREQADDPGPRYDVLVLDAFAGDAIPTHLLTREAMTTYRAALAPRGVLAVHVSNHFLDLRPVVVALARDAAIAWTEIDGLGDAPTRTHASVWMLLTADGALLDQARKDSQTPATMPAPVSWTDDYSSLWRVLK